MSKFFAVIDLDKNKKVRWADLYSIVFPELKKSINVKSVKKLGGSTATYKKSSVTNTRKEESTIRETVKQQQQMKQEENGREDQESNGNIGGSESGTKSSEHHSIDHQMASPSSEDQSPYVTARMDSPGRIPVPGSVLKGSGTTREEVEDMGRRGRDARSLRFDVDDQVEYKVAEEEDGDGESIVSSSTDDSSIGG